VTYDDWRARGPHEDVPNARTPRGFETCETCEVCGGLVTPVSVARCGSHYSYWPCRQERRRSSAVVRRSA
jgi:hypothetical protein